VDVTGRSWNSVRHSGGPIAASVGRSTTVTLESAISPILKARVVEFVGFLRAVWWKEWVEDGRFCGNGEKRSVFIGFQRAGCDPIVVGIENQAVLIKLVVLGDDPNFIIP